MVRARAPGTGPWLQERVGGGVGAGWQFQRRGRVVAWLAVQKSGGEGTKGFGCGGVGGRGQGGGRPRALVAGEGLGGA